MKTADFQVQPTFLSNGSHIYLQQQGCRYFYTSDGQREGKFANVFSQNLSMKVDSWKISSIDDSQYTVFIWCLHV